MSLATCIARIRRPRVLAGGTLLLAAAVCPPASAQFGEAAGFHEAMVADFFSRDMQIIAEGLQLDDDQRVILQQLFRDYQDDFDAAVQTMMNQFQEMVSEIKGGDKMRIMQIVFAPLTELHATKQALKDDFQSTIQTVVLSDEQLALWPAVERRLRRDKLLMKGRLSGEKVDLLSIIRNLNLREDELDAIRPAMDEYELALDAALQQIESAKRAAIAQVIDVIQRDDADASLAIIDREIQARINVRDVNDRYITLIGTMLAGQRGEQFRTSALEYGYPRIFRPTPVQKLFTAAKQLEGLTPEVLEALSSLEATYLGELAAVNEHLLQRTRSFQPRQERLRAENYAAQLRGERRQQLPDELRPDYRSRDDLGRTYVKLLQSVLTEEQFASLPGADRWLNRDLNRARARSSDQRAAEAKRREHYRRLKAQEGENPGGGKQRPSGVGEGNGAPPVKKPGLGSQGGGGPR